MCCLSERMILRLKSFMILCIKGFQIIMATMLSLFASENYTFQEKIMNFISFNFPTYALIVAIFNICALLLFVLFHIYEYYREIWCINNLSINHTISSDYLETEFDKYQLLYDEAMNINRKYFFILVILFITNIINIVLSTILLAKYKTNYEILISIITNIFLIGDKLTNSAYIAYVAFNRNTMYSAYMSDLVIYNDIADKHKFRYIGGYQRYLNYV